MGFFSRWFGGRRRGSDDRSHVGADLTDDVTGLVGRPPVDTPEGHPSAVDALTEVSWQALPFEMLTDTGPGAIYYNGADMATRADIGADMLDHTEDAEDAEQSVWDVIAAGARDADDPDPAADSDR